jgi:cysteinyl-tRNA synthetase
MAEKILGPEFWVHGGGLDLVFPHHENERAQSCSVGRPFARVWAHNGLLRFTGEKMSKSVGNIATIQEVLAEWGRETALLFFLTAHWRKPIDFSEETMAAARAQVESFRNAFRTLSAPPQSSPIPRWADFERALEDDFNTPEALSMMHGWRSQGFLAELRRALDLFGLASIGEDIAAPEPVHDMARERVDARAAKDYAEADRLRTEIAAAGWEVRDIAPDPGYQLIPLTQTEPTQ